MIPMPHQYNLKNIRALFVDGFNENELRTFCFEEVAFEDVYNQLAESIGKDKIIQLLLDHARRKSLIENLLTWAEKQNPVVFERYFPYHNTITGSIPLGDVPVKSQRIKSSSNPWHILVVDDDPGWQRILRTVLKELNCAVVLTSSYDEAKEHLTISDFDLATIDLNLDMSTEFAEGLELVSQIRELFGPNFPIIIVTGKGDLGRQRRAFKDYNVIDFIEKAKFNYQEFKEIVVEGIRSSSWD